MENKISEISELFSKTRHQTLSLCENLEPEDMVIQPSKNVSPLKWHLGHTTWFFEKFILSEMDENYKPFNKDFNYIFNSYYNSVGEYNPRDKRGSLNRPLYKDVVNYRNYVTENIIDFLKKTKNNRTSFLVELGSNHEQQHQELMLMDIKNIFYNNPLMPTYNPINDKSKINESNPNDFILSINSGITLWKWFEAYLDYGLFRNKSEKINNSNTDCRSLNFTIA